jgi:hypothetical protein
VGTGLFAVGGPWKGIRKHFPECRLNSACCRRFPNLIERLLGVIFEDEEADDVKGDDLPDAGRVKSDEDPNLTPPNRRFASMSLRLFLCFKHRFLNSILVFQTSLLLTRRPSTLHAPRASSKRPMSVTLQIHLLSFASLSLLKL